MNQYPEMLWLVSKLEASPVHPQVPSARAVQVDSVAVARPLPDVVLIDASVDDLSLVDQIRNLDRSISIVVLRPEAQLADAILAGADHALPSTLSPQALHAALERAADKPRLSRRVERERRVAQQALDMGSFDGVIGSHPSMIELLRRVVQVAKSRATVLIEGETGTGKELVAGAIHVNSKRANGPLVKLNCAALAESVLESELFGHEKGAFTGATTRRIGRFEQADGGTLFLDEISEVSPSVQVKLLRFLQERELQRVGGNQTLKVDVRLVAATNRNLEAMVQDGQFREDLFYRLNVVSLKIPPLRARPSDIVLLAQHFLHELVEEHESDVEGFTPAALDALVAHPWPGNVRALRNAIETGVVMAQETMIDVADLPLAAPKETPRLNLMVPGVTLAELERWAILETLKSTGSVHKAAEVLGVSRRTIQYRLQSWGITAKTFLDDERR